MDLNRLPDQLPVPEDDGAADHLEGSRLPDIAFKATNGDIVNLQNQPGIVVYYLYPMTGRPDIALPDNWDEIPGARGCTPQSCSFRDHFEELRALNASVYGLSTQHTDYQLEAKNRLHLPFELLSDKNLDLKKSLKLASFEVADKELYKRITLVARDGLIIKIFYPVFPPNENAAAVLEWLRAEVT